ncbi:MAG: YceD family protein [Cyanobacteria bacterium P01_D01_bin.44]
MQPIYIPHLKRLPDNTRRLEIDEHLSALESLTPVKGHLQVQHRGNFLEVSAQAETIMTLACHRCLQHYNSRIQVDTSEFIWLQDPEPDTYGVEREVEMSDLVETLSPQGHFEPATWLYEQFCLSIPQRQLCNQDCPGIEVAETGPEPGQSAESDHRWAALSALKQQLPDG